MNFKQKFLLILALIPITITPSSEWNQFNFNLNKKESSILVVSTAAIATAGYLCYKNLNKPTKPTFYVQNLAEEHAAFPCDFQWGISTSSTQCEESSENNSWSKEYLQTISGKENLPTPDFACKSFEHWQDDIDKVIHLGCNSYRLSIEWSRVQPTADTFDESVIEHYLKIVKYCKDHNISPMICLHHYSDPIWFMNNGGFAQEKNIEKFVTYSQKIYENLRPYVGQWIVISQPVAYAIKGYKVAMQPPFLKDSGLDDTVMLNLFKAHIAVYDMMHDMYDTTNIGQVPKVGICHQIVQMQPAHAYNPLESLVTTLADRMNNQSLLRFFSNGHLESMIPMKEIAYIPNAPKKFDFFALSYYSPLAFNWITPGAPVVADELQTLDALRVIDKDGLYDAITQAASLGKPVYIVENGINPKTEEQRELLLNSYISAIKKALTDGYDVRGYMHWTLMDNYEWGSVSTTGQAKAFGLYKNRITDHETGELHSDFNDHDTLLKQSGQHYKNIIQKQTEY